MAVKKIINPLNARPQANKKRCEKTSSIKKIEILFAEDNDINQHLAKAVLEKEGFQISVVDTGQKVLDILEEKDFDIILMDIQMPIMNGLEATKKIRNSAAKSSKLPIIAMTAAASNKDKKMCLSAGMNDYISKPVKRRELLKKINKYVSSKIVTVDYTVQSDKTDPEIKKFNIKDVIEVDKALEQLDGDIEIYKRICRVYKEKSKEKIESIRKAIEQRDFKEVERLSHALKSSSENIGAYKTREIAYKLEMNISKRNRDIDFQKLLLEDLNYEVKRVISVLNKTEWINSISYESNIGY